MTITVPMFKVNDQEESKAFAVLSYIGSPLPISLIAQSFSGGEQAAQVLEGTNVQVCQFDTSKMLHN